MPTLNWLGKDAVVNHHQKVPFHLLKDVPELSVGDPGSGNLIVQGDNLLALKALLPYYAGQVKCIYIDPPYNTGNEGWIYNDNTNSPIIKEWLGKVVGREAEDLSRHDKWLCMMYPRLSLLRKFLREDGAILISIDDNEVQGLRYLMDEIFGQKNFISTICWQKKHSPQNDAVNFSDMHDYIIVYAKNAKQTRDDPTGWSRGTFLRGEAQEERYINSDGDNRGPWTSADYTCNKTADERPNLYYPIINPNTQESIWPSRNRVWAFDKSAHANNLKNNLIYWGANGKGRPRIKKFRNNVSEGLTPHTWWERVFAGDNQEGRREIRSIFAAHESDFSTPKPTALIKRILQVSTNPDDLILDSFAGSGTTGHAVLAQNKADGGNRRFILVEMEAKIAKDITAERVKRVAEGFKNAKGEQVEGLGGGFRFCELGEPVFSERGKIRETVTFSELARHVYFTESGEPLISESLGNSPLIGIHKGLAVYLLYNGILKDKSAGGGNVLTTSLLAALPAHDGPKIIYGTACRVGADRLRSEGIVFKQLPYKLRIAAP